MIGAQSEDVTRNFDLHDGIRVIRKHSGLIVTIFLFSVFAGAAVSFLMPPTYEGEATLRIKQSKSLDNSLLSTAPGYDWEIQKLLSTYAEIIQSRTIINTVTAKAHLQKVSYDKMLSRIHIEPVKDSEILKVQVRDHNPKRAMFLTNILVDTFLVRLMKLVRTEDSAVGNFIDQYLVGAKQNLEQAEQALESFKRDKKIVAPENETKALLDRLSSMNQLKAENNITLAAAQAKLEAANQELSRNKNEQPQDSPLIGQYKAKIADLEVQLVGLLPNSNDGNPQVSAVRAEIEEVRTKLNTEINKVVNREETLTNPVYQNLLQGKLQAGVDIAVAGAQGVALNKLAADAEREIGRLPAREQELARLMRNVSLAQEIYMMLSKRREEAKISEVMVPTNVQLIDRAVLPDKPIFPNKTLNILMAAFLGLFAGLGLAFVLEYLNTTIDTADDVKNYLNLPVLGNIPDFKESP